MDTFDDTFDDQSAGAAVPDVPGLPGAEAYLEAIYVLGLEEPEGRVRAHRIADYLGVSPVSVSRALTRLERSGDVAARTPAVVLTAQGQRRAEAVVRRHRVAERWLADRLGLNLVEAHREAERLEHALSEKVVQALWEDLGRPTTCPHGNPIPGRSGAVAPAIPLATAPPGPYVVNRLFEQLEGLEDLLTWVDAAGLLPGRPVEVWPVEDGSGARVVRVLDHEPVTVVPEIGRRILLTRPDDAAGSSP
jgi:DtxR family Mn-dependent transcriptional regulator